MSDNSSIKAPLSIWFNNELISPSDIGRDLFEDILRGNNAFSQDDVNKIMCIYHTAKYAHAYKVEVKRRTGERYFEHPKGVTLIDILEFGQSDPEVVMAELLHDLIEDTYYTEEHLYYLFGEKVANIVQLVTNPVLQDDEEKNKKNREMHYKIIALNQGASCVKVSDRIHNLRTFPKLDKSDENYQKNLERQKRKIQETEDCIVPIAEGLKSYNPKYYEVLMEELETLKK
ncbi:HD domain-containing protein [Candidatus Peregrinibacteria bacterium]|jgi:GTP diphosphokinase / guanosine-3',5'-bis(diphosphate) 3'-diphosphatase|nr:HD domain-containing protein [Candidatus Peregrinibacteria bacterium]